MLRRLLVLIAPFRSTLLLLGAIAGGSLIGLTSGSIGTSLGSGINLTIFALIFLLFLELGVHRFAVQPGDGRFILLAWVANFVVVPTIGFLIASIFLAGKPLVFTGAMIYFMAPCTDWFLGFTRLAGGDTRRGTLLIPVNMATQLLLYPFYVALFTQWQPGLDLAITGETILEWFLAPLLLAGVAHLALRLILPASAFRLGMDAAGRLIAFVIAVLVVQIFAANITVIANHRSVFLLILAAVFVFFIATWVMGDWLSSRFGLAYPDHALLTMTTAARNAPLMLGVTVAAVPDQPLVYAAIVIGMLVEFPHLTALTHLLRQQRATMSGTAGDGRRARPGEDVVVARNA